jgi:sulfonate transport system permease protein
MTAAVDQKHITSGTDPTGTHNRHDRHDQHSRHDPPGATGGTGKNEALDIRPSRRTYGPGRKFLFSSVLGIAVILAFWVVGSAIGFIDERIIAPPWEVVTATGDLIADGRLQESLIASLTRAGLGIVIGVAVGMLLATLAGLSRIGESLVDGPVQIWRAVPTLAVMPLFVLWFGIGEEMKITTIALSTLVPVYMNTFDGLRSIDSRFVELASTLEVSRREFIRRVVLPGALPNTILGLRLGVTAGLLALVVVEQVNTTSGIGYLITLASNYGQTEIIIVGLVIYAILGLAADAIIRLIGRRALAWRRTIS